jgi:hypothetical protein
LLFDGPVSWGRLLTVVVQPTIRGDLVFRTGQPERFYWVHWVLSIICGRLGLARAGFGASVRAMPSAIWDRVELRRGSPRLAALPGIMLTLQSGWCVVYYRGLAAFAEQAVSERSRT